jgi:hypothetical protein
MRIANHRKPITIRGVDYPSKTEAAKALGIGYEALRKAIVDGRLDTVGLNGRRVKIDGKTYGSIAEAARTIGVNYEALKGHYRK